MAVLDHETGLVWEQSPSTAIFFWYLAHVHCMDLTVGGRGGWHLPTVQELMSLVDRTQMPPLPAGHPFSNVQLSSYWSATPRVITTIYAYYVSFSFGGADIAFRDLSYYAWWFADMLLTISDWVI